MFDDYAETKTTCIDCLERVYARYPDDVERCPYCGHEKGTPRLRGPVEAAEEAGKSTRRRSA